MVPLLWLPKGVGKPFRQRRLLGAFWSSCRCVAFTSDIAASNSAAKGQLGLEIVYCLLLLRHPRNLLDGSLRYETVDFSCRIVHYPSTGICHTQGHNTEGYNL